MHKLAKKKKLFKINSVILDMDGVITDTMPYHFLAWKAAFLEIGIHVSKKDVYVREGQRGLKALKELFDIYKVPYSRQRAYKLLKNKEKCFKARVKPRFIKGSRSLLRKLKKENFMLALVTGTSRSELLRILPAQIISLFSAIITGTDVRNGKPHPEPYLKALKKLGVLGKDAVVIENAPLGIRSAKNAGIKCLALETSLEKKYLKGADCIFGSFRDLNESVSFIHKKNSGFKI